MLRRALSVLVLALLGAVLLGAGPAYADSAADAQQELLDKYKTGDGFVTYDTLTTDQVKQLSDAVNALSEPLSRLTAAVV